MLGKILGERYQIIDRLGRGGFGRIFLAEDRHLPSQLLCCTVKQFPPSVGHSLALQVARRLSDREAVVLYLLVMYDRIGQLFTFFEEEFYLVRQFTGGGELRQELPFNQPFSENFAIPIFKDIVEILEFVRRQNEIHRDIKPSNSIGVSRWRKRLKSLSAKLSFFWKDLPLWRR